MAATARTCPGCRQIKVIPNRSTYCSRQCSNAARTPPDNGPPRATLRVRALARQPRQPEPRRFHAGTCIECGDTFVGAITATEQNTRTCSSACARERRGNARSAANYRRRQLEVAAFVEPVHRKRIFERDAWICGICNGPVDRAATVPAPRAPTIDHIIPLSLGGTHQPSNARLACFLCNSTRGNRIELDYANRDAEHDTKVK